MPRINLSDEYRACQKIKEEMYKESVRVTFKDTLHQALLHANSSSHNIREEIMKDIGRNNLKPSYSTKYCMRLDNNEHVLPQQELESVCSQYRHIFEKKMRSAFDGITISHVHDGGIWCRIEVYLV